MINKLDNTEGLEFLNLAIVASADNRDNEPCKESADSNSLRADRNNSTSLNSRFRQADDSKNKS